MARRRRQVHRILNCVPSPRTEEDWGFEHAAQAELVSDAPSIPAAKDLRAAWWKVADQGATGSCVGWATADSLVRWHLVRAGRLGREELVSPRFLWMASKETDRLVTRPTTFIEAEGTSLKAALDVARRYGVVRDDVLPFASGRLYPGSAKTFYALAAQLKIRAYFNLGANVSSWRTWLARKGPILTRLDVDETWDNAAASKGALDEYRADTARGGHAVALVGYRPGRFVVRNSWGAAWGDAGFGYASPAYAEEAFTEAYGIEV